MEKFIGYLQEILETTKVLTMDTELKNIEEWDSLSIVSFAAMANIEYGVTLNASQVKEAKTVRDLYNLV